MEYMRIIARHYPNNELRVVICPDRPMRDCQEHEAGEAESLSGEASAPSLVIRSKLKTEVSDRLQEMPLTRVLPGYGGVPRPTGFGSNARRTILRCAGALEKVAAGPQEVAFLTGTLPGSTTSAKKALQDWSSYAVNLLKAKISKLGIHDSLSFYVWELQERGALHIHYAVHVPSETHMRILIKSFKKIWIQVIDAICERSGVDLWERSWGGTWKHKKGIIKADAQRCKKSPGAYMAKYVSKDSYNPKFIRDKGSQFLGPTRWWGCSRPLLKLMKSMTLEVERIGISWYRIKHIREDLLSILDGLNAKIQRYSDKAKTSEVMVGYDQENGIPVFNTIARFLARPLRGESGQECDSALLHNSGDNRIQAVESATAIDSVEKPDEKVCGVCDYSRGGERRCTAGCTRLPDALSGVADWRQESLIL